MKSTKSIVEQYVKAVEDKKAKERCISTMLSGSIYTVPENRSESN